MDTWCLLTKSGPRGISIFPADLVQIKAVPYSEDWSSRERLAILAMCNKLSATIGGCERLVQTPVPLHYVRHTSRFLTIWCFLLPLVIGKSLCYRHRHRHYRRRIGSPTFLIIITIVIIVEWFLLLFFVIFCCVRTSSFFFLLVSLICSFCQFLSTVD